MRSRRPPQHYVGLAEQAIPELLERELAATWPEIEAKLSHRIDPHHLTTARRSLTAAKRIGQTSGSYSGRDIAVLHPYDLSRRKTAFTDAAQRKRRLTARYLRWAESTAAHPAGLIGEAAETVFHVSLVASALHGYRPVRPDGGNVSFLLGESVEGGPLDDAAFLQTVDPSGLPRPLLLLVVEVKNVRHWLYPSAQEIYQLLHKAALLLNRSGDLSVVPLLICRRRHFLTYEFARTIGFVCHEMNRQYLLPHPELDHALVEEVRTELGFSDLFVSDSPDPDLVKMLSLRLPGYAHDVASRWRNVASLLEGHFEILRGDLDDAERLEAYGELKDEMEALGIAPTW